MPQKAVVFMAHFCILLRPVKVVVLQKTFILSRAIIIFTLNYIMILFLNEKKQTVYVRTFLRRTSVLFLFSGTVYKLVFNATDYKSAATLTLCSRFTFSSTG